MKQKNNLRFRFWVLLVALLALSLYNTHAAKAAETEAAGAQKGDSQVNWLFVMTGTSGSFDGKTITLHNVPPTLMFSDRPYRIFGHMDTAKLIKEVSTGPDSFAEDPPNAVLSTFGGELPTSATVVLYKPTLTGNTLSFPVKVSEGNIPDKFEGATLFIDHWHHHGHRHGHPHWHPHVGALIAGAAVGSAVHHASEPKTVVVQQPAYYYQATPPPPAPAPAPDKPSTKSPESRLEDLKSMYNKGHITKSDYDQKKKQIIDQM
jgi:hypothetical protein